LAVVVAEAVCRVLVAVVVAEAVCRILVLVVVVVVVVWGRCLAVADAVTVAVAPRRWGTSRRNAAWRRCEMSALKVLTPLELARERMNANMEAARAGKGSDVPQTGKTAKKAIKALAKKAANKDENEEDDDEEEDEDEEEENESAEDEEEEDEDEEEEDEEESEEPVKKRCQCRSTN
jgi:hypothetical protein